MMRKFSEKDVERSSSVFWVHGDNVLSATWGTRVPYSKEELRLLLNFHALFAEHVCVIDTCLLHNDPLRELIMYDGYDALLSNSILVPMLRSSVNNFDDLEYQLRHSGRYGLLDTAIARPYASFLNENVSAILPTAQEYFEDVLTEDFEASLLNSDFLVAAGLSPIEVDMLEYTKAYRKKSGREELIRSMFFFFADELAKRGHPRYAARVKWISSALWNNVFITRLDLRPALPDTYSEALLKRLATERDALRLQAEYVNAYPFENTSIDLDDFRCLDARSLLAIRKTSEAKSYFKGARQAARESDPLKASKQLAEGLESYLPSLMAQVAAIATGRQIKGSHLQNRLRLIKWGGLGGNWGIGLANLLLDARPIAWATFGAGLIWVLGSSLFSMRESKRARNELLLTCQQWEAMKKSQGEQRPIINVTKTRRGEKAPLF